MNDRGKNIAQSVLDRLKSVALQSNRDYNHILIHYVCERFLFRLGMSQHRDRFVLKGAMLFVVWTQETARPTRNLQAE